MKKLNFDIYIINLCKVASPKLIGLGWIKDIRIILEAKNNSLILSQFNYCFLICNRKLHNKINQIENTMSKYYLMSSFKI